ncbi:hypothetical protein MPL3356_30168 [Mesorhizobium plurifarium]|uniref:Uncharacterized protein n=1 Tax=Mesorhizobium plurifarium TaxID=69974 RepID=A0A090DXG4_MESPL|nr:hypothetical protein MPL3356_30168 [Mesorhizobium plurifarium]
MSAMPIVNVSAAPHRPAGHFSPYSDGEKGLGRALGGIKQRLVIGETVDESAPSPRHYTGRGCRQAGEGQRLRPKRISEAEHRSST